MTEPVEHVHAHEQVRAATAAMLEGTGLHIEQRRLELIITNPHDSEKGQVCITLDDAYVTWERTETSYWGHLDGIPNHDQGTRTIPASKIVEALTGRM
jgi:hypothetical protein